MNNPYQPAFDLTDATIAALEGNTDEHVRNAVDLLRRFAFVIANLLNTQAQLYVHLVLPPEVPASAETVVVEPDEVTESADPD